MTTNTRTTSSKPEALSSLVGNDIPEPVAPALPVDLQALPDDVLALLATEAPKEVERRKQKREAEFLETVRAQAELLGVTPARLHAALIGKQGARQRAASNGDGRSRVKPKLWNPTDHSQR